MMDSINLYPLQHQSLCFLIHCYEYLHQLRLNVHSEWLLRFFVSILLSLNCGSSTGGPCSGFWFHYQFFGNSVWTSYLVCLHIFFAWQKTLPLLVVVGVGLCSVTDFRKPSRDCRYLWNRNLAYDSRHASRKSIIGWSVRWYWWPYFDWQCCQPGWCAIPCSTLSFSKMSHECGKFATAKDWL